MTASQTEPDMGQPPTPVLLLLCAPIRCCAPIAPHPSPTCTPWPVPPDIVSIQIASVGAELNCRVPSWCGGASGCVQSPPYMPGVTSQVCSRAKEKGCVFSWAGTKVWNFSRVTDQTVSIYHMFCAFIISQHHIIIYQSEWLENYHMVLADNKSTEHVLCWLFDQWL